MALTCKLAPAASSADVPPVRLAMPVVAAGR
jgi:hypothetical protein